MAVDGIDADAENRRILRGEVLGHLAEAGHFRRTDEGEIGGIEKQHQPFALVAGKRVVRDVAVENTL